MRRSAMTLTGNNFYRRENEARGVELACQPGSSIGVFDDMKLCPDGINILSLPGWRIVSGVTGVRHYDLITEQNGFEIPVPGASDASTVTIQPNISFIGDFSFQFDTAIAFAGTTAIFGINLYPKGFIDPRNYMRSYIYYYSSYLRFATTSVLNAGAPGGTTGDSNAQDGTKIRFRRVGTTIYLDYYKPSAWQTPYSLDMTHGSPVVMTFYIYNPDTSNYINILMKNFVLNSGRTQILW